MKTPQPSFIPFKDDTDKILNVKSIIDSSISEFNKKYSMISNILNEMKSEFLGQMTSVMEYLSTRKEQQNDYNTNTYMESNQSSSPLQTLRTEVNDLPHKRISDYTSMALRKSSINQFNEKTKAKKVLARCEKDGRNAGPSCIIDRPFLIDLLSFTPVYKEENCVTCPYCSASYKEEANGKVCAVCGVAQIGLKTLGLVCRKQ